LTNFLNSSYCFGYIQNRGRNLCHVACFSAALSDKLFKFILLPRLHKEPRPKPLPRSLLLCYSSAQRLIDRNTVSVIGRTEAESLSYDIVWVQPRHIVIIFFIFFYFLLV
ncbi:hypothetical protein VIGAN_03082200, partial [Vigna angularis var. angularis]